MMEVTTMRRRSTLLAFCLAAALPTLAMGDTCLSQPQLAGVIFGSVGATLVICITIAAIFWMWLRRSDQKEKTAEKTSVMKDTHDIESKTYDDIQPRARFRGDQTSMIESLKFPPRKHLDTSTQKSYSLENINEARSDVGVLLKTENTAGFGMNIQGNMNEGIYVKAIVPMGAADQTGNILPGDRIKSLTINFDNMVYEDALTLLSYASPYKVKFELERKVETPPPMDGDDIQGVRLHPLFRSNTLTHIHFNPIAGATRPTFESTTQTESSPVLVEEKVESVNETEQEVHEKEDDKPYATEPEQKLEPEPKPKPERAPSPPPPPPPSPPPPSPPVAAPIPPPISAPPPVTKSPVPVLKSPLPVPKSPLPVPKSPPPPLPEPEEIISTNPPEIMSSPVISEVPESTTIADTDLSKMESSDYASDNTSEYRESENEGSNGSQTLTAEPTVITPEPVIECTEVTDLPLVKPTSATPISPKVEYCKALPPKQKSAVSRSPSPKIKPMLKPPSPASSIKAGLRNSREDCSKISQIPSPMKRNISNGRIPLSPARLSESSTGPPEFVEARVSRIPKRTDSVKTPIIERKLPPLPKSVTQRSHSAEDNKGPTDVWSRLYTDKRSMLRKTRDVEAPSRPSIDPEASSTMISPLPSPGYIRPPIDYKFSALDIEYRERLAANQEILDRQTEELKKLGVL